MRTDGVMDRAVLDAFPEPVVVTDPRQCILLANQKALVAFGYGRAELLGRPLEFLLPRGVSGGQALARRKDGSEFPAEVRVRPAPSRSGALEIVCLRDASNPHSLGGSTGHVERLATFGLLAAEVAHESRNALDVLSSRIDLMLLQIDGTSSPAVVREDLAALQHAARRLAATFERLLSYAVPSGELSDRGAPQS